MRASTIDLDNNGRLEALSAGSGNGGNLTIVADTIKLDHFGAISATMTPLSVLVDWVTLNPSSDHRNSSSVTKKTTKRNYELRITNYELV